MLAPSATMRQPLWTRAAASAPFSSFWVAHGSAMSQGTCRIEPPVRSWASAPRAAA
jgi:hypothetical protein